MPRLAGDSLRVQPLPCICRCPVLISASCCACCPCSADHDAWHAHMPGMPAPYHHYAEVGGRVWLQVRGDVGQSPPWPADVGAVAVHPRLGTPLPYAVHPAALGLTRLWRLCGRAAAPGRPGAGGGQRSRAVRGVARNLIPQCAQDGNPTALPVGLHWYHAYLLCCLECQA